MLSIPHLNMHTKNIFITSRADDTVLENSFSGMLIIKRLDSRNKLSLGSKNTKASKQNSQNWPRSTIPEEGEPQF